MLKLTLIAISLMLTACASTVSSTNSHAGYQPKPLEPYNPMPIVKQESDDNFTLLERTTHLRKFECELIADLGRTVDRYQGLNAAKQHSDKLTNCKRLGFKEVDILLSEIRNTEARDTLLSAVKNLYSTWRSYMIDISVYEPENPYLKQEYTKAAELYSTELKFR